MSVAEPLQIWAVTDGRAGNAAQALGLAEAIARARPARVTEQPIALRRWAAAIPPTLSWWLTGVAGWPFSGLTGNPLAPPWPDLVIGAGRRSGPIVAALRRRLGIAAVQLLSPQMPASAFDAVVVPGHDGLAGDNVLTSIGAISRLTPETIARAATAWDNTLASLPEPRVAVLVGGPSRSSGFGAADGNRLMQALHDLSQTHGLIITPSRRTPAELSRSLADLGARTWAWDGKGPNPYPGLLAHADAVLVTEESVNMASEAATAGLPVHIFPVTRPDAKITRFHQTLAATGASRPFHGKIATWSYPPLAEADRIADELLARGIIPA